MSMHERLERIEAAYLAAIGDRFPETVPHSIWRAAILDAVLDVTIEEIIEMFHRRVRKASRGDGSSFGATDAGLIKTLVDIGMCHDCATRVVPLICTRAIAS
jgi:cysteine synthase